ncbi:MAG: O-methyltransferase [Anaerorhabdus sp.]
MKAIEIIKEYAQDNNVPIMMDDGINYICNLIIKSNYKTILECGSAIGYSAIKMASINKEISIDTIEIKSDLAKIAVNNVEKSNLSSQIKVFNCDAMDFKSEKLYDLIFIDAAKAQYKRYMEKFMKNLADDGVFIFDNMEFHGIVNNPSLSKSRNTLQLVKKIKKFRDYLLSSDDINCDYFPEIGDGIAVVRVKSKKNKFK